MFIPMWLLIIMGILSSITVGFAAYVAYGFWRIHTDGFDL